MAKKRVIKSDHLLSAEFQGYGTLSPSSVSGHSLDNVLYDWLFPHHELHHMVVVTYKYNSIALIIGTYPFEHTSQLH